MPTVSQHFARRTRGATSPTRAGGQEPVAPVVLMVSGGADSTALLVLACTSTLDIDDGQGPARIARERLHVLHVNHHLRGEASDGDEAFVRALCERYGLDPASCLFVDDSADNCTGAEAAGMRSLHFTGTSAGDVDGCTAALERAILAR